MARKSGEWELPPDPHHIATVRRQVASFAAHSGMASTTQTDLQVAVSDAITSVVLQVDGADPVRVHADDLGDQLLVRVREGGRPGRMSCPALGPRLAMIAALAQGFGVRRCEGGSTELSMRFALAGS